MYCNQHCAILMGNFFTTCCEFIKKLTFVNAYSICFIQNFDQYFLEWKPFIFEFHYKIVNLCFLQSALPTFDSKLCRFPGSWLEFATHHVSLLSHYCIAYRMRSWSEEMEPAVSKLLYSGSTSRFFFALNVGPAKISTLPNVVSMYAKSITLTLKLRSGNKSKGIVNLTPIQSVWFYETTINNNLRWLSIVIG